MVYMYINIGIVTVNSQIITVKFPTVILVITVNFPIVILIYIYNIHIYIYNNSTYIIRMMKSPAFQ